MRRKKTDGVVCPVCGGYVFEEEGDHDICDRCGWENDNLQDRDHNYAGGANDLSVNEARIEFFLLNNEKTSAKAEKLHAKFLKADRTKEARENYLNELNGLLNKDGKK